MSRRTTGQRGLVQHLPTGDNAGASKFFSKGVCNRMVGPKDEAQSRKVPGLAVVVLDAWDGRVV